MKPIKLISAIVPILIGVAAAHLTTIDFWWDMKEGLIAFLGFLAASLVQVMPITANFLQADRLTPSEAARLNQSLTSQQYYWIGLLSATIFALVVVIVGAALKGSVATFSPLFTHPALIEVSWSAIVVFVISSSVSFVMIKMLGLFSGILSLHKLRCEIVMNTSKRLEIEKAQAVENISSIPVAIVPKDYGRVMQTH